LAPRAPAVHGARPNPSDARRSEADRATSIQQGKVMKTMSKQQTVPGKHHLRRRALVCALMLAGGGFLAVSPAYAAAADYCEVHSGAAPIPGGPDSFACGVNASAAGAGSTAIGSAARADLDLATAVGQAAIAGYQGSAFGQGAHATFSA